MIINITRPGLAAFAEYVQWHGMPRNNNETAWDAIASKAIACYLANIGRAGGKRGGKATTPKKVAAAKRNGRMNRGG